MQKTPCFLTASNIRLCMVKGGDAAGKEFEYMKLDPSVLDEKYGVDQWECYPISGAKNPRVVSALEIKVFHREGFLWMDYDPANETISMALASEKFNQVLTVRKIPGGENRFQD